MCNCRYSGHCQSPAILLARFTEQWRGLCILFARFTEPWRGLCVHVVARNFYPRLVLSDGNVFHKGASIYYVRKFFGILDPLPPLLAVSRNLSVLSFAKLATSFTPLPPLGANVINGSPLIVTVTEFTTWFFVGSTTDLQGRAKKFLLSSVTHVPSGLMSCALAVSMGRKRAGKFNHAGIFLHDPVEVFAWSPPLAVSLGSRNWIWNQSWPIGFIFFSSWKDRSNLVIWVVTVVLGKRLGILRFSLPFQRRIKDACLPDKCKSKINFWRYLELFTRWHPALT